MRTSSSRRRRSLPQSPPARTVRRYCCCRPAPPGHSTMPGPHWLPSSPGTKTCHCPMSHSPWPAGGSMRSGWRPWWPTAPMHVSCWPPPSTRTSRSATAPRVQHGVRRRWRSCFLVRAPSMSAWHAACTTPRPCSGRTSTAAPSASPKNWASTSNPRCSTGTDWSPPTWPSRHCSRWNTRWRNWSCPSA